MIARLQKKLEPLEQEAIKIKKGINLLCELDGEPPLYAGIEDAPIIRTQLQGDEYHNMPQATAITEILERRKSVNLAPVTIDEIYEDLIAGGFQFMKGKNEAIQKRGLAIAMSKNRKFYKLPNEKWGIKSWYNIKETTQSSKSDTNGRSENESTEGTETEKGGNNEQSE
jgi:DNA-directed RNA polymerase delta subunit